MAEEAGKRTSRVNLPVVISLVFFLCAFLIRIAGIGWGLPNDKHHWSYHPDEPDIWIYSQSIKPAEGKFTPGFYNYGTFYLTLLSVSTDVVNGYGGGPKAKDGSDEHLAIRNYHLAGRVISSLAGAGIVCLVFLILWRRTHPFGAIFGAAAAMFAPGLVIHSRFQTVDVLATFLLTIGFLFTLNSSEARDETEEKLGFFKSNSAYLLAGLFFGLSAGTKYTGLLGLMALAVVCYRAKKWKEFAIGTATCFLTFVVTTPGIVLDSAKFWRDFGYEMAHTSQGHGLVFAGTVTGFIYHLINLGIGFGTILLLMGVVGLVRAGFKKHTWALALAAFAILYFVLIGRAEVKFLRYTFPLIPILACGAGWLFGRAHVHPNVRWRAIGVLGLLGIGGFFGGGMMSAVQSTWAMADDRQDPRSSVLKFMEKEPGTVGLVSDPWFYTADLYPEAGSPRRIPFSRRNEAMLATATSPNPVLRFVPTNPDERFDWDVRLFDAKPKYIVFSSFETEGVDWLAQQKSVKPEFQILVDRYRAFAERLQTDYTLMNPGPPNQWAMVHDLMYIRPTLWVWKRKTDSSTPSSGSSTRSGTSGVPANIR